MRKRVLRQIFAGLVMVSAMAATPAAASELPQFRQDMGRIDAIQRIPADAFQMVESEGKVFFLSDNGRYVIRGTMYDLWSGAAINSVDQLKSSGERISFAQIGLDTKELFGLDYGKGKQEVTIFTAPGCPYCAQILRQLPALESQYTFRLVPLPFLGDESVKYVKQLACAAPQYPKESLNALMTENYELLPVKKEECDLDGVRKSLISAQLLGIKGVPFVVAPDGRTLRGATADLASFLKGGM